MLSLLNAEVAAEPASQQSSAAEVLKEVPAGGLAGVLAQLRQQGSQARMGDYNGRKANEEHYLNPIILCLQLIPHFYFTIQFYYIKEDVCKNQNPLSSKLAKLCTF